MLNYVLMRLKDDVVPNFECLADQHFQHYQTWRIIHLLLMFTRKLQKNYAGYFFCFDNRDYGLQGLRMLQIKRKIIILNLLSY